VGKVSTTFTYRGVAYLIAPVGRRHWRASRPGEDLGTFNTASDAIAAVQRAVHAARAAAAPAGAKEAGE
jgi:hypothetical protein